MKLSPPHELIIALATVATVVTMGVLSVVIDRRGLRSSPQTAPPVTVLQTNHVTITNIVQASDRELKAENEDGFWWGCVCGVRAFTEGTNSTVGDVLFRARQMRKEAKAAAEASAQRLRELGEGASVHH